MSIDLVQAPKLDVVSTEPAIGSVQEKVGESVPDSLSVNAIVIKDVPILALLLDQNGDPYIAYEFNGKAHVGSVRSRDVRNYIRYVIYELRGEIITEAAVKEYTDQIEAHCLFEGQSLELFVRVARDGSDFLVDGVDVVYRFIPGSWSSDLRFKPIFKRPQGLLPLALPVPGGDLKKFLEFVNIKDDEDKLLILIFIVASFIPDIPHPPLIIYGPQGSSKSTLLRFLIELIDPASTMDLPFRNERDFMLAAGQRWVIGLDNVSFINGPVSDIFCKLVTGASFTTRMLYTNEDLLIRNFRRVLIINGINIPVEKPDLMDRSILMRTERIKDDSRRDEASLRVHFEQTKGEILGGCFDALSKAMKIYPTINVLKKQRMADFATWGCAIAQALGYTSEDFLKAYDRNIELQHEEALDASPIASLIFEFFKRYSTVSCLAGTPTYVYRTLRDMADAAGVDERQLPRTPLAFSKRLQESCANLEAYGYHIVRTRGKDRQIKIYPPRKTDPTSVPSVPSLAGSTSFPNMVKF